MLGTAMRTRWPGHAAGELLKVGFRQITEPRLWTDPVANADDKDKERNAPGSAALPDLMPYELSIQPNQDLTAINFKVVDGDGRGFVITIYDQETPDILLLA
jgi:hypothetical protein